MSWFLYSWLLYLWCFSTFANNYFCEIILKLLFKDNIFTWPEKKKWKMPWLSSFKGAWCLTWSGMAIRSPLISVSTLLSSMTEFIDSIHSVSTGASNKIHFSSGRSSYKTHIRNNKDWSNRSTKAKQQCCLLWGGLRWCNGGMTLDLTTNTRSSTRTTFQF